MLALQLEFKESLLGPGAKLLKTIIVLVPKVFQSIHL